MSGAGRSRSRIACSNRRGPSRRGIKAERTSLSAGRGTRGCGFIGVTSGEVTTADAAAGGQAGRAGRRIEDVNGITTVARR